ncbi:hypothetical protein BABINDRAFT_161689 [Babjeviella inositovora NRRL Y-12698]|uniref:Splicing factor subunit n=1 Tax=Babjeviella inositovora NRRL Y-12698 TaxID=984486 RepID=A0A1E3QT01_9ASCO|nr:uncharacterized protein BABINDRAFT_161689 [Babjeviella inositovora NRRL Y-12698]ODQ80047.1 hypothetical protein BABINDRAFT_161689 [Babjeviella inositovora NRRL Y-12698]
MADKVREQRQYDHLKARHIGLGNADTTKLEWMSNVHRDTYASFAGNAALCLYYSVAMNESLSLTRTRFIEKMIQPCGPKPTEEE